MNIKLDSYESFDIHGRTVTVRSGPSESTYRIPSGARVSLRRDRTSATLLVGGFKSATVTVSGPIRDIERLRDSVLGHPSTTVKDDT